MAWGACGRALVGCEHRSTARTAPSLQVQSMAQLGVHLLLFSLGLEFSLSKLKAMRNVAMLGTYPVANKPSLSLPVLLGHSAA